MAHTILLGIDSDSVYEFVKNIPLNAELIRAKTPEELEEKIQEIVPEVIVVDADLAEGKGKEVVSKLKKDPTFGAIPIIYLKDVFEETEEDTAVEWTLNKPFTKEDFVEALKSIVGDDVEVKEEKEGEEKEEVAEEKGEEKEEVIDLSALEEEEGEEEVIDLSELEKEKTEEEQPEEVEEAAPEEPKERIEEAAEIISEFKEVFERKEPEREPSDIEREFLEKLQDYISYVVEKKLEDILSKYEIKLVKKSE